ncbi:hypothetical protein VTI28DRAFT_2978 [Corynascus sepedonium]
MTEIPSAGMYVLISAMRRPAQPRRSSYLHRGALARAQRHQHIDILSRDPDVGAPVGHTISSMSSHDESRVRAGANTARMKTPLVIPAVQNRLQVVVMCTPDGPWREKVVRCEGDSFNWRRRRHRFEPVLHHDPARQVRVLHQFSRSLAANVAADVDEDGALFGLQLIVDELPNQGKREAHGREHALADVYLCW